MSHGNAVLSAPPLVSVSPFYNTTEHHLSQRQSTAARRNRVNHEAFPNHQRVGTRRPVPAPSAAAGKEFHQKFHQEQIWRQTSSSSAGPHRTTNWWWGGATRRGEGGRGAVLARLSTIPDPNATKLFLVLQKLYLFGESHLRVYLLYIAQPSSIEFLF